VCSDLYIDIYDVYIGMWSEDRHQAENMEKFPDKSSRRGVNDDRDDGDDDGDHRGSVLNYEVGDSAAVARQKILESQRMEVTRDREEFSNPRRLLSQAHPTTSSNNSNTHKLLFRKCT